MRTARPQCTGRGWGLSMPVAPTCTSYGTKARSKRAPWLSSLFRLMLRAGLMPMPPGTARSDQDSIDASLDAYWGRRLRPVCEREDYRRPWSRPFESPSGCSLPWAIAATMRFKDRGRRGLVGGRQAGVDADGVPVEQSLGGQSGDEASFGEKS